MRLPIMSYCLIFIFILIPSILSFSEYDQINLGNENFRASNGLQFMSKNSKTPFKLIPIDYRSFDRNILIPSSNQFTNNKRNEIGDNSGNLQTSEMMKILNDLRAKASARGKEFFG